MTPDSNNHSVTLTVTEERVYEAQIDADSFSVARDPDSDGTVVKSTVTDYQCEKCGESFETSEDILLHVLEEDPRKPYERITRSLYRSLHDF